MSEYSDNYENRVRALEAEGLTRSDAQAAIEAEDERKAQEQKRAGKCSCGSDYEFNRYCGAYVCCGCGSHKGMDRCYCGFSRHGGDGYRQLLEDGEQIEEDY